MRVLYFAAERCDKFVCGAGSFGVKHEQEISFGCRGGTIGGARTHRVIAAPNAAAATATSTADKVESNYNEAIETVSNNYAGEIDYEKATQAAIQGMLSTLDPHSMYFPQTEFTKLKEDQDSRFYGIGVTILHHRDGVYVQSAVEGTPAARAGLRYGDRITEVDGKDARDWTSEQVSKHVRDASFNSQLLHDSQRHRLRWSDGRIPAHD